MNRTPAKVKPGEKDAPPAKKLMQSRGVDKEICDLVKTMADEQDRKMPGLFNEAFEDLLIKYGYRDAASARYQPKKGWQHGSR